MFKVHKFQTLAAFEDAINNSSGSVLDSWCIAPSGRVVAIFQKFDEPKQPAAAAKVIPIDGGRLESATLIPTESLPEQIEEYVEPLPWDHSKIAVNKHSKE